MLYFLFFSSFSIILESFYFLFFFSLFLNFQTSFGSPFCSVDRLHLGTLKMTKMSKLYITMKVPNIWGKMPFECNCYSLESALIICEQTFNMESPICKNTSVNTHDWLYYVCHASGWTESEPRPMQETKIMI